MLPPVLCSAIQRTSTATSFALTLGLSVAMTLSCKRAEPEPASTPQTATSKDTAPVTSSAKPPASSALPAAEISWTKPSAWSERPPSAMRKASYVAPGPSGDAEVAVFYFGPSSGGGTEANIARWLAQFVDLPADAAVRDKLTVNGFEVSTVRIASSTFSSGMPGGPTTPKENWGMYAAVVETPSGAYFFKMTGPRETVAAEEKRFIELINSVQSKK